MHDVVHLIFSINLQHLVLRVVWCLIHNVHTEGECWPNEFTSWDFRNGEFDSSTNCHILFSCLSDMKCHLLDPMKSSLYKLYTEVSNTAQLRFQFQLFCLWFNAKRIHYSSCLYSALIWKRIKKWKEYIIPHVMIHFCWITFGIFSFMNY